MKTVLIVCAFAVLTGCSAVAELIPSLKYCDAVDYKRVGVDINITAKCKAPVG